jgi:hypothetical protein
MEITSEKVAAIGSYIAVFSLCPNSLACILEVLVSAVTTRRCRAVAELTRRSSVPTLSSEIGWMAIGMSIPSKHEAYHHFPKRPKPRRTHTRYNSQQRPIIQNTTVSKGRAIK